MRQLNSILNDLNLLLQAWKDVDRGVSDEQGLGICRHIHNENVADPATRGDAGVLAYDFGHQLIGMQTALHQSVDFAGAHQCHRVFRCGVAVGLINQMQVGDIERQGGRQGADARLRSDKIGLMIFASAASRAPVSVLSSQGWATAVRTGAKAWQL